LCDFFKQATRPLPLQIGDMSSSKPNGGLGLFWLHCWVSPLTINDPIPCRVHSSGAQIDHVCALTTSAATKQAAHCKKLPCHSSATKVGVQEQIDGPPRDRRGFGCLFSFSSGEFFPMAKTKRLPRSIDTSALEYGRRVGRLYGPQATSRPLRLMAVLALVALCAAFADRLEF
jgi:hypothetical protein